MRRILRGLVLLGLALPARAWLPGGGDPVPTAGFAVDTTSRNDVVAFWHGIYRASDGYWDRMNWTGNYGSTAAGAEGSVSPEFVADVERRVNFVRALCGVPPVVSFQSGSTVLIEGGDAYQPAASTAKEAAARRAAFMVAVSTSANAVSHDPPPSLTAWTTAAWNASSKSSIAKGFFGPGAVDAYFHEDVPGVSSWNYSVGHRRWLLGVSLTEMATGDTPGSFNPQTLAVKQPSNVLYVKPKASELAGEPARFVSYPAAGFFPVGLNSPTWSLSRGGADFSSALVSMTDGSGSPVPVSVVSRATGYAENAIAWSVPAGVASTTALSDRSYHVTVSGIGGGGPTSHSWTVTLIDPERLLDDPVPSGPDSPVATEGGDYTFVPVAGCDVMETGFFRRGPADWEEGAEDGTDARVVDGTAPSYDLRSSQAGYASAGAKSFRLTFPTAYDPRLNGVPDQGFGFDRELLPGPGASVEFKMRRGYMTQSSQLLCERTDDGGLTWQTVGSPFAGASNGQADAAFSQKTLPLGATGAPVRLRFRLHHSDPAGSLYDHERYPTYPTGVFLDEIRVTGCDWLEPGGRVETGPAETAVHFGVATATLPIQGGREWWLRTRPVMSGHALTWSSAKIVTPIGVLDLTGSIAPPVTGANYRFLPEPSADAHFFEVSRFSTDPWSEGAEDAPVPKVIDGTSAAYPLISTRTGFRSEGAKSFRLGVQPSDGEDFVEIDRDVLVSAGDSLDFWARRGYSSNQTLEAEVSTDGGSNWTGVWSLAGTLYGSAGSAYSVDLAAFAGEELRVRFVLRATGTVSFNATYSGMWIDAVTVNGSEEFLGTTLTPLAPGATTATLDATTAGGDLLAGASYRLRIVPSSGGIAGVPGPVLTVVPTSSPVTGFAGWMEYQHPELEGGFGDATPQGVPLGFLYAFGLEPAATVVDAGSVSLNPTTLTLERGLDTLRPGVEYRAEASGDLVGWSEGGVTVSHAGGVLRAEVSRGAATRFLRWKLVEN